MVWYEWQWEFARMKNTITFRGMESSDAIKKHVDEKLTRLDKFHEKANETHTILSVEGYRHIAEFHYSAKKFQTIASAETNDMYASIDEAISKLEKTVRRHHDKVTKHG